MKNLINYIEDNLHKQYIWGQMDCFMMILKYLEIGEDHYNKYKTLRGAVSYYKKHASKFDDWLKDHNYKEIKKNFEQNGDLIKVDDTPFCSWGIYYNSNVLVANHKKGICLEPIKLLNNFTAFRCYG